MKWLKLFLFCIVFALVIAAVIVIPKKIKVSEISCSSQYGPCRSSVEQQLDKLEDKNLAQIKREINQIIENDLLVEDYSYQFKLPNRLEVVVLERKSYFALKRKDENTVYLIDKNGLILSQQEKSGMPVLEKEDIQIVDNRIDQETMFSLLVLKDLNRLYGINKGVMEKDGSLYWIDGNTKAIFPLEGDREVLIGSLLLIMQELNQSHENLRIEKVKDVLTIDLRYKNPIIN